MSLKTGSQAFDFPENARVKIMAEGSVSVFSINEDGENEKFLCSGEKVLAFRTKDSFTGFISVPNGNHFSVDVFTIEDASDKADPIPVELPEEMKIPETLESKLHRMLAGMIAERYGTDSNEMETFEEAMDFDVDDTEPLSGYEVQDMVPEVPNPEYDPPETTITTPLAEPSEVTTTEQSTGSTEA